MSAGFPASTFRLMHHANPASGGSRLTALLAAAALSLVPAAGAFAAAPKAGRLYTGFTSAPAYHGFTAPVNFTVSRSGRQLLGFRWAGGGCIGLGGPGNAWTNAFLNYRLGTINVSRAGTFSVKKVRSTNRQGRTVKVTISTVTGRFKTATTATGTIRFTQRITGPCSGSVRFTAVLGAALGGLRKTRPANGASGQPSVPTLGWTASRNATGYRYCVDTSNNEACDAAWVSTGTRTQATLTGLAAGAKYYWQVRATSPHGAVAADNDSWYAFTTSGGTVRPEAGSWVSSGLSGPVTGYGGSLNPTDSVTATSIFFTVAPDRSNVSGFGLNYTWAGPPASGNVCAGSGSTTDQTPAPIVGGGFATPAQNNWTSGYDYGTFTGAFDTPTTAHGTAWVRSYIGNSFLCSRIGYAGTGIFSWTATWQP